MYYHCATEMLRTKTYLFHTIGWEAYVAPFLYMDAIYNIWI